MANNNMDEKCGELFEEATRYNETLIDFEFNYNGFKLEDVTLKANYPNSRFARSKTT